MVRLRLLSLTAVVAGLILGAGSLVFDRGSASADPTIEGTLDALVTAWNAKDFETFAGYFTDEGLDYQFGVTRDNAVEGIAAQWDDSGSIVSAKVSHVRLEGGVFTGTVDIAFDGGFSLYEDWQFVQSDGGWLVGAGMTASRPIPPGVPAVDLSLQEYAFNFNAAAIQAADGNFAFKVTQRRYAGARGRGAEAGQRTTPFRQSWIAWRKRAKTTFPRASSLSTLVACTSRATRATLSSADRWLPDVTLSSASCRLKTARRTRSSVWTPSSAVGSAAPAPTGGSGGGITPPNTGDAGLLDQGHSTATWLMLGLALVLVLGGSAGLVKSRVDASA